MSSRRRGKGKRSPASAARTAPESGHNTPSNDGPGHGRKTSHKGRTAAIGAVIAAIAAIVGIPAGIYNDISAFHGSNLNTPPQPAKDSTVPAELSATVSWPIYIGCDGGTPTAILPGGPAPTSIHWNAQTGDPRTSMIMAGGASWGMGHLVIHFSVRGGGTVSVEGLKPLIFNRSNQAASWVYQPEGGCGGEYTRDFALNLDAGTLTDSGVQTEGMNSGHVPTAPLGPGFRISSDDPADVVVDAQSCRATYAWGLRVIYFIDDKQQTLDIGSPSKPFRSTGVAGSGVTEYTSGTSTALSAIDSTTQAHSCLPS